MAKGTELTVPDLTVQQAAAAKLNELVPAVITSKQQEADAGTARARIRGEIKRLEAERDTYTRPLKEVIDRIRAAYQNGPLGTLNNVLGLLDHRILTWRAVERKRADEAAAKAEADRNAELDRLAKEQAKAAKRTTEAGQAKAAAIAEQIQAVEATPTLAPVIANTAGAATYRKTWAYEVVDLAALPIELIEPNAGAINDFKNAEIRAGRIPAAPGLQFYQKEGVA